MSPFLTEVDEVELGREGLEVVVGRHYVVLVLTAARSSPPNNQSINQSADKPTNQSIEG